MPLCGPRYTRYQCLLWQSITCLGGCWASYSSRALQAARQADKATNSMARHGLVMENAGLRNLARDVPRPWLQEWRSGGASPKYTPSCPFQWSLPNLSLPLSPWLIASFHPDCQQPHGLTAWQAYATVPFSLPCYCTSPLAAWWFLGRQSFTPEPWAFVSKTIFYAFGSWFLIQLIKKVHKKFSAGQICRKKNSWIGSFNAQIIQLTLKKTYTSTLRDTSTVVSVITMVQLKLSWHGIASTSCSPRSLIS